MKKTLVLSFLFTLFSCFIFLGCTTNNAKEVRTPLPNESGLTSNMKGEHKLRKMFEREEHSATISGSYFLVVGGFSGRMESKTVVRFAWQMNDGTYAFSALPLEAIRLRLKKDIEVPTVEFSWYDVPRPHQNNWDGGGRYGVNFYDGCYDCQSYVSAQYEPLDLIQTVRHAVVTIQESDWPVQIKPPGESN